LSVPRSYIEEDRLPIALQVDVEPVDDLGAPLFARRDQGAAPDLGFDEVEDGIGGVRGLLVREVHPSIEPDIDTARDDPEIDVGGHRAMPAAPHRGTRLHGLEAVKPGFEVAAGAAPAAKLRIESL